MQHLNSKSLFEWYTRNSVSESIVFLSYSSNIWPVPYVSYDDARLWNLSIFWIIFEFVSRTIENTLPHTPNAIAVQICIHHCMEMNVDDRNIVVADAPAPHQASWIPEFSWIWFPELHFPALTVLPPLIASCSVKSLFAGNLRLARRQQSE